MGTVLEEKYVALISKAWFEKYGRVNPNEAFAEWEAWLKKKPKGERKDDAYYRKLLRLASGKGEATIRNYLNIKKSDRLSEHFARILDDITLGLGKTLPAYREKKDYIIYRNQKHIAFLTDLEGIPSLDYHLGILKSISRHTSKTGLDLSIHQIISNDLVGALDNAIRAVNPGGIIIVRRTPDDVSLKCLEKEKIPTVLIHADQRAYSFPVIRNIVVSADAQVEARFRDWVKKIPADESTDPQEVVIATMSLDDSHRKKRFNFVERVLTEEGIPPVVFYLPDYSFRHAYALFDKHPDALAYICFCDPVAVEIKHLLLASGRPWKHKVIGFDNSQLAEAEQITSFDQNTEAAGVVAVEQIYAYYKTENKDFKDISVNMYMAVRD